MEWIKKIKDTFLKEIKVDDEIIINELEELEKTYIDTAYRIADKYRSDRWIGLIENKAPIKALEEFIAAEQQILDRLKEIKKLQEK